MAPWSLYHRASTHYSNILCLLSEDQSNFSTVSDEKAAHVEELGIVGELLDLWCLEVSLVELLGRTKAGDEAPVVASDDDSARTSGVLGRDLVRAPQAFAIIRGPELLSQIVVANSAKVSGRVLGEDVLSCSRSVLCRTSGNILDLVVLDDVLVDALVLRLDQDGVIGLEVVLLQHFLAIPDGHVQQRVAEGDEVEFARHCVRCEMLQKMGMSLEARQIGG